jgi:hypothetical protein
VGSIPITRSSSVFELPGQAQAFHAGSLKSAGSRFLTEAIASGAGCSTLSLIEAADHNCCDSIAAPFQ